MALVVLNACAMMAWIWGFGSRAALCLYFAAVAPVEAQTNAAKPIVRTVQIVAKRTSPVRGLTATGNVKIAGTLFADSFDSAVGPYSPSNKKGNAYVGTTSKKADDFMVTGTAKIVGQLGTGAPGVLKTSGGGTASVGSDSYVTAGYVGVEPGYVQDDLNVSIDGVTLPFNPLTAPGPLVVGPLLEIVGTKIRYYTNIIFNSGNYAMTDLIITTNMYVYVNSNAVLSVRNFQVDGGGALTIASNASFDVYFSRSVRVNSNTTTNNTFLPSKFCFYGLPSATTVHLTGDAKMYAYIYAPSAGLTITGMGEFFGASITQTIDVQGNSKFHYDEALLRQNYRYVPVAWKELLPNSTP